MPDHTNTTSLRPQVRSVLGRLRRRIRQYVLLEGTALVLVVLAVLFWFSIGFDWVYFQVSRLDLPVWFRQMFGILTLVLFVGVFLSWVGFRFLRRMGNKALGLVLERRFPELDDRLITAIEAADDPSLYGANRLPLTEAMLNRTIDDAARAADQLDVAAVFDRSPLRRALLTAAVLIASIGGFWLTNAEAMHRWSRAYLYLDETYWDRDTDLIMKVVVQPGDQIRDFRDASGRRTGGRPGAFKHAAGADLSLLVEVPDTRKRRADGAEVDWIAPERVTLTYQLAGGGTTTVTMARLGDRQFRHSIASLTDSIERMWITGGDYTNRQPYEIRVVDPPRVDRLELNCRFPDYTGMNDYGNPIVEVQGTQVSIPVGTEFALQGRTNKPLRGLRLQTEHFELNLATYIPGAEEPDSPSPSQTAEVASASLIVYGDDEGAPRREFDIPLDAARQMLSADGRQFSLPFSIRHDALEHLAHMDEPLPAPFPPDALLRIYLEDTDEIIGGDPARLTINGVFDQPPLVETRLKGIGTSITRKATIPITGRITDDYGIAKARFEFLVDEEQDWRTRPFRNPPAGLPREFTLQRTPEDATERFDVLPLDLSIGQKLTLSVYAEDADDLTGPNVGRGDNRYVFTIVSNEELLSILYGKELNLRRRFEQIIKEVEQTQQDLILHRVRSEEAQKLQDNAASEAAAADQQAKLKEILTAVSVCAERSIHQANKNAAETASVEEEFRGILEELLNNNVHTEQMVARMDDLIIKPLNAVNRVQFPEVIHEVTLFRFANEKGNDPIPQITASVDAIEAMLVQMRRILAEMQDLVEFHEALKNLESIIKAEEQLAEETKKKQKAEFINKLKGLTD